MLSFTSSLSPDSEAFAVFVNDKYEYKGKKDALSENTIKKINSYLSVLKAKKKEEDISSFDISDKQKCFIIKVKNKHESFWPQENGGSFFSYLKNFKDLKKVDIYADILNFEKDKLVSFFFSALYLLLLIISLRGFPCVIDSCIALRLFTLSASS